MNEHKGKVLGAFVWRLLQNIATQAAAFAISIILARILLPEDYGLVAIINVFITIALVFINTGFSSAVIQKKEINPRDLDTIFYTSLICGAILYAILYLIAPAISVFYDEPRLTALFRVECLIVPVASIYSVQQSLITRNLWFNKGFVISLVAMIFQGAIGISLAYLGYGVWALVISTLANSVVSAILAWIFVGWRPGVSFSVNSFRSMFAFSMNILASGVLTEAYNNIKAVVIGKQYSSADLAFYNRGNQFPTLIMVQVDGALTTVMFPSLSKYQDNWEQGLSVMRKTLKLSMYICVPLMFGLIAVAEPMVRLLLTDKWLPCVKYMQLTALICMTWPLSMREVAIKGLKRSDIALKLNVFNMVLSLIGMLFTYKISVMAILLGSAAVVGICQIVEAFVYEKYLQYKISELICDILPTFLMSFFMCVICLYFKNHVILSDLFMLLFEILIGTSVYIALSLITKNENFFYLIDVIKGIYFKRFNKKIGGAPNKHY